MEWESSLLALSTRKMMAMAGRGDQFLSLGLCLEMSICVVAVAGSLLPVVYDVPVSW